ncbi:type II toxin-antitoxin system YafO family toxin [Oceanobacter mangrovi]|uniref:type II toxin-antitoxin system YafO family toxin n=1 Tax=Oceanobacter mangrovi TaxID=2862510 RepID=UPI001C8F1CFC|nr:type II toxin-antitoxin system YafO family toxin [Oceanobacter mangrovi]
MSLKVFAIESFKQSMTKECFDSIIHDFKSYKSTGVRPDQFGRDTSYDFSQSVADAGLRHKHVKDKSSINWHLKRLDYDRASNTALIYCEGFFNPNEYLLLGFLRNAHETYNENRFYLLDLAAVAEEFRELY